MKKLDQYHHCWCPGSLHCQVINSHGIYYVRLPGPCLTWVRISKTCLIFMSKYNHVWKMIMGEYQKCNVAMTDIITAGKTYMVQILTTMHDDDIPWQLLPCLLEVLIQFVEIINFIHFKNQNIIANKHINLCLGEYQKCNIAKLDIFVAVAGLTCIVQITDVHTV